MFLGKHKKRNVPCGFFFLFESQNFCLKLLQYFVLDNIMFVLWQGFDVDLLLVFYFDSQPS